MCPTPIVRVALRPFSVSLAIKASGLPDLAGCLAPVELLLPEGVDHLSLDVWHDWRVGLVLHRELSW